MDVQSETKKTSADIFPEDWMAYFQNNPEKIQHFKLALDDIRDKVLASSIVVHKHGPSICLRKLCNQASRELQENIPITPTIIFPARFGTSWYYRKLNTPVLHEILSLTKDTAMTIIHGDFYGRPVPHTQIHGINHLYKKQGIQGRTSGVIGNTFCIGRKTTEETLLLVYRVVGISSIDRPVQSRPQERFCLLMCQCLGYRYQSYSTSINTFDLCFQQMVDVALDKLNRHPRYVSYMETWSSVVPYGRGRQVMARIDQSLKTLPTDTVFIDDPAQLLERTVWQLMHHRTTKRFKQDPRKHIFGTVECSIEGSDYVKIKITVTLEHEKIGWSGYTLIRATSETYPLWIQICPMFVWGTSRPSELKKLLLENDEISLKKHIVTIA